MNFESNQTEKLQASNSMENTQENKGTTFSHNSPSKFLKSPSQKISPNSNQLFCSNCESARANKACSFKYCQRCCQLYQQEKEGKLTCVVSAHRLQIRSLEKFYQSSEEESEEKDYEEEEDSFYYDDESNYEEEEESYSEESDYEEEEISKEIQTKSPNKSQIKEETKNIKVEKDKESDKKNYRKNDKKKSDIKEEKNKLEIKQIKDEMKNEKNTSMEGNNQIEIKSEKKIEKLQEIKEQPEGKSQVEIKQEKNEKKEEKEKFEEKTYFEMKPEKNIELKDQKEEIENTQNQRNLSKKSEDLAQIKLPNIIITKQVDSPYRKVESDSQLHENKKYEENNNNYIYKTQYKEENRNRDYEERYKEKNRHYERVYDDKYSHREKNRNYENRSYERDYDDRYSHREENRHRDYDDKYYRERNRNYENERSYDDRYSHREENRHRDYDDKYYREKNRNYENRSYERDYIDRYQSDNSKKNKYEEQSQTEIRTLELEQEMEKLNITDNEKSEVNSFDRKTYKIYPCPQGNKCVKLKCIYYHNDKDRRRSLQILPILCKEITKDGKCSYGDNCKYAHNQFEFHFTEQNYKSKECNFYLENGYCRFEECCAYIHKPDARVQAVIDLLKTYEKKHFIELRNLLPPEIQQNLARSFYPFLGGFRGWKEEGFEIGDKKLLKEKLSKVKAKMAQCPMTEVYAAQLRYVDPKSGNFPAMMNYARIVAEEIGKTELGQNKSSIKHLVRTIKYNTNWAHHSQDEGEPLFSVTPRNQEEAIDALMKLTEELLAYHNQQK